ncbi:hypothetical protein Trydic_g15534 [Trypoxylus dichotomus]
MFAVFNIVPTLFIITKVMTIWPPPYRIHLNQSEDFVIFETIGREDSDDILYSEEDEMIKPLDIRSLNISKDSSKYIKIHKLAIKQGKKSFSAVRSAERIKWPEYNYDNEEGTPWVAGHFINNKSQENTNVYYLNEMAKRQMSSDVAEKRSYSEIPLDYDYEKFKEEYESDMKLAQRKDDVLNVVDVTEEEQFKDAFKSMLNFSKTPRNCTKEEIKGIGLAAVECFWYDFKKVETKEQKRVLLQRIYKLIIFWIVIYVAIAVPCWCQKGWCCCCFRCRFCKPRLRIDDVKRFHAENPPGVYYTDRQKLTYKPTHYEKYAQKRLEQAILSL